MVLSCLILIAFTQEGIIDDALTSTLCGTRYFWAPEMIESMSSQYGVSVDWWALGVMMYKMMKGHLPFKESNKAALFESIIRGDVYYPPWLGCDAISILKGEAIQTTKLSPVTTLLSSTFYVFKVF